MDTEQHDMLIRIDERTLSTKADIKEIKKIVFALPCSVQKEKVKTLERITWGALLLGIGSAVKAISDSILK
jgi:hypothetical protein